MIGGFPHRYEDSFFHLALEQLRRETRHHLLPSQFTFGGFPITRVAKHLAARGLAAKPHVVVLQFGSSDLVVPLRRRHKSHGDGISAVSRTVSANSPSGLDQLKWQVRGLVGDGLALKSVTPPETYLATLVQLAQTLLDHQVLPVVMSPFVFGDRRSDRLARDCARRLQDLLAALLKAVYVDAYSALDRQPRSRMLLSDGSHLSLAGHQVVGQCLFTSLKQLVESESRVIKPSSA